MALQIAGQAGGSNATETSFYRGLVQTVISMRAADDLGNDSVLVGNSDGDHD